jgi:hypothetical protein
MPLRKVSAPCLVISALVAVRLARREVHDARTEKVSDTPRTDALCAEDNVLRVEDAIALARQLERELAVLVEALRFLRDTETYTQRQDYIDTALAQVSGTPQEPKP